MVFDPMYFLFVGPAMLLALWAGWKTKSAFGKYSKIPTSSGMTGAQAAQRLLDRAGISDVEIVPVRGRLTDHYNPVSKKLALSEAVYQTNSVAAVGVACHEAGHAIQHAKAYKPLWLRSAIVPVANIGGRFSFLAIMVGLIFSSTGLFNLGLILFTGVVAFQLITLPVEFDATARAKRLAPELGIVNAQELGGMNQVLNAAALTYVAAALQSIMTLLYFLSKR